MSFSSAVVFFPSDLVNAKAVPTFLILDNLLFQL